MVKPFYTPLDIEKVRDSFPVLKNVIYLNVGTYGIMPEPALKQFIKVLKEIERGGVATRGRHRKLYDPYDHVARMIGSEPDEIAFNRNATDGINFALSGINWQPGDEIISTSEEHEAVYHPLLYLQKTKGIKVRWLEVSPDKDTMLSRIQEVVNPRTRLIAISYVTCETGTRLPVSEICKWASEHNIMTLIDGAQATGAFPIKVKEMGCDFYASNLHKWLCGPKGSGFFYCSKEKINLLSPAHIGAGSLEHVDKVTGMAEPHPSARRFEFGTRAFAIYIGAGCSLNWFDGLGWHNVYEHISNLSEYLKECIIETPYLNLLSPRKFEESSGLVSFVMPGHNAGEISTALREKWNMFVRVIPHYNAIRISTAHFNNDSDIQTLMEALHLIHGG